MTDFITKNNKTIFYKVTIFLFWIIIWQIAYLLIQKDIYLPSPFDVFSRLSNLLFKDVFWSSVFSSIYRVLAGFSLAAVSAIILGIIASLNKHIYDFLNPAVTAVKSTPVMSFIIIALVWFKSTHVPIFICFLMCFPIIWTNFISAIKNVDVKLLEMSKIYNIKKSIVLKKVFIPSITPYLLPACITALGLGWKVNVAAEVLSLPRNSIGIQLYSAKVYLDSIDLFSWTFIVIVLSLLFESIFSKLTYKFTSMQRFVSENK